MKAYLDYNIFTEIDEGHFSIKTIYDKVDKAITDIPFSSVHIREADNISAVSEEARNTLISKRLQTIKNITNGLYIYQEHPSNQIFWLKEEPENVLKTIRQVSFSKTFIKSIANRISNEQKQIIRKLLGIEIKELNNYCPTEVINHLNTKLTNWGTEFTILEILDKAISLHPDNKDFGLHNKIAGIMELLDMLGYWKDKPTQTSNFARLWDANHIYFASYCDYFLSKDERLMKKAKVIYNIYNIKTNIVSLNDVIE